MIDKLLAVLAHTRRTAAERGASAVEYGLLVAGIAAVIVLAVFALGPTVSAAFTETNTAIGGAPAEEGGEG